jgi:hypothetical protein
MLFERKRFNKTVFNPLKFGEHVSKKVSPLGILGDIQGENQFGTLVNFDLFF